MNQQTAPTINIINQNQVNAGGGAVFFRKKQSASVHFWLFLTTAGMGNVLYAWHVNSYNKRNARKTAALNASIG